MSATSSEVRTGSAGRRLWRVREHRQAVERTDHGLHGARCHPGVQGRGLQLRMPQQHLDDANINAVFEQVSGEAVTQGMRPDPLGDPCGMGGLGSNTMHLPGADGLR